MPHTRVTSQLFRRSSSAHASSRQTSNNPAALGERSRIRWTDGRVVAAFFVIGLIVLALGLTLSQGTDIGSAAWALGRLEELPVKDSPTPVAYSRDEYEGWQDLDGDCQNTRHEVLVMRSEQEVQFTSDERCKISAGQWTDAYTGTEIELAADASIDHVVSLRESHHSGAWRWSDAWKQALFNDIDDPASLTITSPDTNSRKGSGGPEVWLPHNQDERCSYLVAWVRVKTRWSLSTTASERNIVADELETCVAAGLPSEPVTLALTKIDFREAPPAPLPVPTPVVTPDTCDERYQLVCIPESDQDLNCEHVVAVHFPVGPLDPHRFDGDRNGIGCETY